LLIVGSRSTRVVHRCLPRHSRSGSLLATLAAERRRRVDARRLAVKPERLPSTPAHHQPGLPGHDRVTMLCQFAARNGLPRFKSGLIGMPQGVSTDPGQAAEFTEISTRPPAPQMPLDSCMAAVGHERHEASGASSRTTLL
jgi:hypothetical protein